MASFSSNHSLDLYLPKSLGPYEIIYKGNRGYLRASPSYLCLAIHHYHTMFSANVSKIIQLMSSFPGKCAILYHGKFAKGSLLQKGWSRGWSNIVTSKQHCHLARVTCYMSPVMCHVSRVTCHLSPVPCNMSKFVLKHFFYRKKYI